jgi:hypothetical protein
MSRYVIERDIPGAGRLSAPEIISISRQVCSGAGQQVQWLQSYVTGNKLYCVYSAPNDELVREHAQQADRVSKIAAIIDPAS